MEETVEKKVVEPPPSYNSQVWEHFGFYYIDGQHDHQTIRGN